MREVRTEALTRSKIIGLFVEILLEQIVVVIVQVLIILVFQIQIVVVEIIAGAAFQVVQFKLSFFEFLVLNLRQAGRRRSSTSYRLACGSAPAGARRRRVTS